MTKDEDEGITPAIRRTIRAEIRKALGEVPLAVVDAQDREIRRRRRAMEGRTGDPRPGVVPVEPPGARPSD